MSLQVESSSAATQGLDRAQLGHIRRIEALSKQLRNDWSGMESRVTAQDDFGAFRFQLAFGAWALALAHRHRLPNAPAVFKPTFERLIEKMLLPEVWLYWRDVSRGGGPFNAHLVDQLQEQWDPVARDNIMYSAYLQSMVSMYQVLFDDDRYARPNSLTLDHFSFSWGGGPHTFHYDEQSITDRIYWQMVENGYLGVACEPNCVFQVCNQPAIIGFRMHDIATGSSIAEEVVAGYERAWSDYGRLDDNGHYRILITEDTKTVVDNAHKAPHMDAWLGAMMNAWNRDFVREHYRRQVSEFLVPGDDGTLSVKTDELEFNGRPIEADGADFGWVTAWASEMGDTETLNGLLAHADRYMNPTWSDGALYYPRNDTREDADGNLTLLGPITGNILIGYARLNVPDGLWGLYNEPWDRDHFSEPLVVELGDAVDLTRADFDRGTGRLTIHAARRGGDGEDAHLDVSNVTEFELTVDGREQPELACRRDDLIRIDCPHGGGHELVLTVPSWSPR
ncbi:MAG: hypothetical protein JSS99_11505 [Actinobacteria bacterium]|nr:hypothetical protein [Actinomycetota bacterium]